MIFDGCSARSNMAHKHIAAQPSSVLSEKYELHVLEAAQKDFRKLLISSDGLKL